jgi:hypothetical protein
MAVVLASALAFFGPVVWPEIKLAFERWPEERRARAHDELVARNAAENRRPPRPLPHHPGDRAAYLRESFSVRYQAQYGFMVDTRLGIAVQERMPEPDSTYTLMWTPSQIDTLYEAALASRMFSMSQPELPSPENDPAAGTLTLRSSAGEVSFHWRPPTDELVWSDDFKRIHAYVLMVDRMVWAHPATRALPPRRSASF